MGTNPLEWGATVQHLYGKCELLRVESDSSRSINKVWCFRLIRVRNSRLRQQEQQQRSNTNIYHRAQLSARVHREADTR